MKIVDFEKQFGEDWLAWRRGGIGSSDIATIAGSNPYESPWHLWHTKKGNVLPPRKISEPMMHGIAHEPICRSEYQRMIGVAPFRPICVEDVDNPRFRASLDGFHAPSRTLIEIKCPVSPRIRLEPLKWTGLCRKLGMINVSGR